MDRLAEIADRLPEATRVDIEAWDGEPTFRVRGKNFVFTNPEATGISVKLPKDEADALVATDPNAEPTGYGLGRHGWVSITLGTLAGGRGVGAHLVHARRPQAARQGRARSGRHARVRMARWTIFDGAGGGVPSSWSSSSDSAGSSPGR
jgi:hypothetical protein